MKTSLRILILVSSISCSTLAAAATDDLLRTVALRGQSALGPANDARFQSFSMAPILNADGQTAFTASLQQLGGSVTGANDTGVWSEGSGALALVAREGSPAPGTPQGTNFGSFSLLSPSLNDAGQTAFIATLMLGVDVSSSNDAGVWSELGGPLAPLFREGTPFVGEPAGAAFGFFSPLIRISENRVAFSARLQQGPGGVTTANDSGIWRSNGGALEVAAREGGPAPGTDAGIVFRDFDGTSFALGADGHVGFLGRLSTDFGGVTGTNDTGVWTDGSGPLALLAREGSQAPGTPPGVNFGQFDSVSPSINAIGQAAFHANLQVGGSVTGNNDSGIWAQNGSSLDLVAREGNQAPGTPAGATFGTFGYPPAINTAGETVFVGSLRFGVGGVTSGNDTGIWVNRNGALELVAREGSPAPGTSPIHNFSSFSTRGTDLPVINAFGRVAFSAIVSGPNSGKGIWAEGLAGMLRLIVRQGDLLEVAPGDFRTVSSLSFRGEAVFEDSRRGNGFNDSGQVAFHATFSDGSSGIFVSNVATIPEPTALVLVASSALLGIAVMRRTHRYFDQQLS